jgi:inorganic pyrophosphatase
LQTVREGAAAFLKAQYGLCLKFTAAFAIVVLVLTWTPWHSKNASVSRGIITAISFAVGAVTSIVAGYIGMQVAVFANARVTIAASKEPAEKGWRASFNCAFIGGSVMGFSLCSLAMLVLFVLINIFKQFDGYKLENIKFDETTGIPEFKDAQVLFDAIAGYGLGGSSMALFGRVGGGIFTKAADVGADLSGKVAGVPIGVDAAGKPVSIALEEDSPLNPATIADNVGDNVGDVAGMGSDLFGSFAEASCAALVISASSLEIGANGFSAYMFPIMISAAGILVCLVTGFIATHVQTVAKANDVEWVLKVQLLVSSLLMTVVVFPLAMTFLPSTFHFTDFTQPQISQAGTGGMLEFKKIDATNWGAFICVAGGLWGGCLIGFITEYYTSHSYTPVQEVSYSCEAGGAATNIIYGLALGYLSCILPITLLAINVFVSFTLCGMYGVALAAIGMLGTLATCLSIDVYGPIADNAGGLAEMSEFPDRVRNKTDALDAAGNTTAAIGKGFAIGSAALVSLALFGGFVSRIGTHVMMAQQYQVADQTVVIPQIVTINVLRPITFAFLFLGAMLPYWFTAMCMKSVGAAAMQMVQEVENQFKSEGLKILAMHPKHKATLVEAGKVSESEMGHRPDYKKCIGISTEASLKEMIAPGCLVMFTPILVGAFFGVEAVSGLLVGSLISAVQLAISQSNSGGAWDNAKKFVECGDCKAIGPDGTRESGQPYTKKSKSEPGKSPDAGEVHAAAVVGDTVGDPLKDTSGPALNIVMKLMAIISLVFCDFFISIRDGRGIFDIESSLPNLH